MEKEVLFVHENEQKLFNKAEYVDNYIFFVFEDKIVAILRQKSILQQTKHLFGY